MWWMRDDVEMLRTCKSNAERMKAVTTITDLLDSMVHISLRKRKECLDRRPQSKEPQGHRAATDSKKDLPSKTISTLKILKTTTSSVMFSIKIPNRNAVIEHIRIIIFDDSSLQFIVKTSHGCCAVRENANARFPSNTNWNSPSAHWDRRNRELLVIVPVACQDRALGSSERMET
uniref:Uncharacterized protein n=1 Tax=Lotharella oceanica TaxID=641309 RepID=A0A7S2XDX5_9EUKA|mmetsp:Transcript_32926/g.61246  ORF Transcript_32926/g.61246 Transcript_32926/m.61246 type:complete len:175 (+) Transcript_32926:42-566(+)